MLSHIAPELVVYVAAFVSGMCIVTLVQDHQRRLGERRRTTKRSA